MKTVKKTLGRLCEYYLSRTAAKTRATGIHIIAATQRPSVKVVEGNIKANCPARISFKLPSDYDSRTMLSCSGAEQLLSQGTCYLLAQITEQSEEFMPQKAEKEDIRMAIEGSKDQFMEYETKVHCVIHNSCMTVV